MTKMDLLEKYPWMEMLDTIDLISLYKDAPPADYELKSDLDAHFKWLEDTSNG